LEQAVRPKHKVDKEEETRKRESWLVPFISHLLLFSGPCIDTSSWISTMYCSYSFLCHIYYHCLSRCNAFTMFIILRTRGSIPEQRLLYLSSSIRTGCEILQLLHHTVLWLLWLQSQQRNGGQPETICWPLACWQRRSLADVFCLLWKTRVVRNYRIKFG
jgi:hypothetical protein